MSSECFVLRVAHGPRGLVTILDFPPNEKPHIGMTLIKNKNSLPWKVIGIGLPIVLDVLEEKIETHYDNRIVWDCLLNAVDHSEDQTRGDILKIKTQE